MLIRKVFKSNLKSKKEAPGAMTSTPNASGEVGAITPDVSIIERTCSSPVLISAESMEDLEVEFFDRMRVSALHPGTRIVQRAGHCVLSPARTAKKQAKEHTETKDNLSYMRHLATELQKSVVTLNKMQAKTSASNLREPSSVETNQSSSTKSCGEVAGKLTKCSSPFKENFSLQTFETAARQTSPLQIQTNPYYKTTATQQCPQSLGHSNLTVNRPLRPIPSLSCPSTPRDSRRAYSRSRSRSQSPSPGGPDLIAETQRRTNTLKDIIHKITTTFSNGESSRPQISRAESTSPTRPSSNTPPSRWPRCVHFTPRPASASSCPTRGDVQELYFNKGMKNSCKPCTQGFESPDFRPWTRKDSEKDQPGPCPATCKCKPRPSKTPTTPSIEAVTMRCSSCQLPKPATLAPCQVPPPPCQAQPAYPRGSQQPPSKADTGLSCTESLCSVNSASGVNDAKRAQYLQNKLHAVHLCLKNKEETVRVQAESLTCAEQRIALLTIRAAQQRRELETVQRELIKLKGGSFKTEDDCCQARSANNDVCCSTLGNPCLNADASIQLETNTEECIDTCTLKRENKNLRELNQGLEIYPALKTIPKYLFFNNYFRNTVFVVYPVSVPKCKISDLCEQKTQLECTIREKDDTINCLRRENDDLCCEMRGLRSELEAAKKRICEIQNETGCVRKQLTQAQEEVGEVKSEICRLQARNEELTRKNKMLSEELERADDIIKENCKIRSEVSYLTQQVALWRQQLADSEERVHCVEAELARARSHCRNVDQCYREKVDAVAALEVQLQQAHSRGAQLCAESRRVVATVRNWIHRMQDTNAEQCQKIKAQQSFIAMLQKALQDRMAEEHVEKCPPPPPPPPDNPFPRESEDTREFTIETVPCPNQENDAAQDLDDLVQESCDYYSNYRAQLQNQTPFGAVGCSKCAAKRPADPSRSPTDDSDDIVPVGCSKCAPKRKSTSKGYRSEITIDFQVGCSKCAPKRGNRARKDTNEETESGSARSQATSTAKSTGCGCEREDGANQVLRARGPAAEAGCSHIPGPPRRLLRKKLCQDRVAHYLYMQRCTAASARSSSVQEPARRDSCTQPCSQQPCNQQPCNQQSCSQPPCNQQPCNQACASPSPERRASRLASRIPMPRAVSPTGELLERVSRLSDAMEESQRRWSRSKLPQHR